MNTSTPSRRTVRAVVAGGVAAAGIAATVALATPAAADEGGTGTAAGTGHPGICQRLDRIGTRGSNLVVRLEAGPDTRGSIAWLEAKAQAATAAGDNDLAQLYSDRAARRTKAVEVLKALGLDLTAFREQHCG